jgi:hypothetical protein
MTALVATDAAPSTSPIALVLRDGRPSGGV